MKPAPFDYYAPTSVDETCSLLARYGSDAKLLAGGQSLVPLLALRLAQPATLIDLNGVHELDYIRADDNGVAIGAMTRQRTVERSSVMRETCPLLPAAVEWIGHPQIRNRGTIGGSLVHSDPAAELPALATLLDATFSITNAQGAKRTVKPDEFFVTYLTTAVEPEEMLSEIYFPTLPAGTGWSFVEVARRHGDFALVGAAATVALDSDGACSNARIALFGVAPTATRSPSAEQALLNQKPDEQAIAAAASEVVKDIDPPGDVHASVEYRKYVATNLVRRALTEAVQRAK
jgi:aerobic carbon-monoxide dehydrogenase medium subunit